MHDITESQFDASLAAHFPPRRQDSKTVDVDLSTPARELSDPELEKRYRYLAAESTRTQQQPQDVDEDDERPDNGVEFMGRALLAAAAIGVIVGGSVVGLRLIFNT